MGNYILKQCLDNVDPDDDEILPLIDYSNQINEINSKCDDTNSYLIDELNPVINELKSRLYNLEVKNNYMNRELASIKYKINENEDEFSSIVDDSEKSEVDINENENNSLIDID